MSSSIETDTVDNALPAGTPGLVVVFSQHQPVAIPIPLDQGPVEIGRDHPLLSSLTDTHISRLHFRVGFQRRFTVTDLGSRNGTSADGIPLKPNAPHEVQRVIRAGDTLFLPVRDIALFITRGIEVANGVVIGPATKESFRAIQSAAAEAGRSAQIIGEAGTGKEVLARALHAAGPARGGPFQAMRCTVLPEDDLDRLLFGARPDTEGYLRASHGGTLLIEGIAQLSEVTQARLLVLLAQHVLVPAGGGAPERLDVRFAFTTRQELRADVEGGTLLEDLYFRLCIPRVTIPPLRERPEEIPFLLDLAARRAVSGLPIDASLVEVCLLRPWPGNVRELMGEARNAAYTAHSAGATSVGARFLDAVAGVTRDSHTALRAPLPAAGARLRESVIKALTDNHGNVAGAARALDVHRNQLRRWLDRFAIDPRDFLSASGE